MQNRIDEFLEGVRTVAIAGHVGPDGDCIGSCMGMYLYLRDNFPQIQADVYLDHPRKEFSFIQGMDRVYEDLEQKIEELQMEDYPVYDLLILLDISSKDRIGVAGPLVDTAKKTLCFDHHVTNRDSYTWVFNKPEISSASEVLFGFLDPEKISEPCAEALYTGIAHDTGVFQYSSTSPETMRIAAQLMEKGIPFNQILDDTFYQKSYVQNQILGRTLMESILLFDGKVIAGYVRRHEMDFYGVTPKDMDGIVAQLRNTRGVEVAIFLYEKEPGVFKVSLRSKNAVDVSAIASVFKGGGHVRAAGCTMTGSTYDVINNITYYIEQQFKDQGILPS